MKRILSIGALLLCPALIFAHTTTGAGGFVSGVMHPILGFDHFLAMLSVGIISAQIGGNAVWNVPLTFMAVMFIGGMLGMQDLGSIPVETGIALSVILLGAAIGINKKLPVALAMVFVGVFAIFHGYAHGLEMPKVAIPYIYALGFLTGTAGVHLVGVFIGHVLTKKKKRVRVLTGMGWLIALAGVYVMFF